MSNLHRIAWIDAQIRARRYPNATAVAREFEISRRQAARDIEYLRYSLQAPLEYCAAKNGYRYSEPGFALAKDAESLPAEMRRSVPAGLQANAAETRSRLRRAISDRQVVVLRAGNPAEGLSIGRVHPYRFAFLRDQHDPYLVAFCEQRRRVRAFHLAFVESVEATGQHFREVHPEPPEILSLKKPYSARLEIDRGPIDPELDACIDWIDATHCVVEFRSSSALLGALFAGRRRFRVEHPNWLRERLLDRLRELLDENAREGGGGTRCVPPPRGS